MGIVRRTSPAIHDLGEIWYFIAKDNPDAADRFVDRLEDTFQVLADSPEMGRDRGPDFDEINAQMFPVGNYNIHYGKLGEKEIIVYRVLHAAKIEPRSLTKEE